MARATENFYHMVSPFSGRELEEEEWLLMKSVYLTETRCQAMDLAHLDFHETCKISLQANHLPRVMYVNINFNILKNFKTSKIFISLADETIMKVNQSHRIKKVNMIYTYFFSYATRVRPQSSKLLIFSRFFGLKVA